MSLVKQLMIRAGADFSAMRREMGKAKSDLNGFKGSVSKIVAGIGVALASIGAGFGIKSALDDAMKYEASLQQINRMMQTSAGEFKQWAEQSAIAFGISRKEAVEYGAVFSNLIGTFANTSKEIKDLTTNILKTSAVISGATGRDMDDVMFRIRSGLLGNTEAIEDLGVNVNVAMLESTEAFKNFANGRSWAQLSFQTQQQIRLFGIMEQSAKKYGEEVAVNTASNLGTFIAVMRNVKLGVGQAFMPLLNIAIPILTKFALALDRAMQLVAQFSQALFGKASNVNAQAKAAAKQAAAVTGVGDAYKAAGKKAKAAADNLQGFDQVNNLSKESDSASGADADDATAAGGGMILDDLSMGGLAETTLEVTAKVQEMANRVKAAYGEMRDFIKRNSDLIISSLAGVGTAMVLAFGAAKWTSIVAGVKSAVTIIAGLLGGPILVIAAIIAAVAAAVAAFVYFYRTNEKFKGVVDGILQKIGNTAKWLWDSVLVPFGKFIADSFIKAWEKLTSTIKWLWDNVLVPLGSFMKKFHAEVIAPLAAILKDVLGVAFGFVSDAAKILWQNVLVPIANFFKDVFGPAVEALSAIFNFFWKYAIKPLAEYFGGVFLSNWKKIVDIAQYLWDLMKPFATYVGGRFMEVFRIAFENMGDNINRFKNFVVNLLNYVTDVFTGDWENSWEAVKGVFTRVFNSLANAAKAPLNAVLDMINKAIDGMNKLTSVDIGGKTIGITIPKIPKLARGGITKGTTNMGNYVAGEAGAEMIVPLENTSFTDKIAAALGSAVMTAMSLAQGQDKGDTVIQLDGVSVARALHQYTAAENKRIGGSMITTS